MSSYREFAEEKEKIDSLKRKGYQIRNVTESLDGAVVEFEHRENREERQKLLLETADARKYVSSIVFEERRRMSS